MAKSTMPLKKEFEALIGKPVEESLYEKIYYLYRYYPTTNGADGLQRLADIFIAGGESVIADMLPKANKNRDFIRELNSLEKRIQTIKTNQKNLIA